MPEARVIIHKNTATTNNLTVPQDGYVDFITWWATGGTAANYTYNWRVYDKAGDLVTTRMTATGQTAFNFIAGHDKVLIRKGEVIQVSAGVGGTGYATLAFRPVKPSEKEAVI